MNLTLLTYTNSKVIDLHKAYFDRINKFFNIKKHIVLSDVILDVPNIDLVLYRDEKYYEQILMAINKIDTDYIIYSQEDYIIYDNVDINSNN